MKILILIIFLSRKRCLSLCLLLLLHIFKYILELQGGGGARNTVNSFLVITIFQRAVRTSLKKQLKRGVPYPAFLRKHIATCGFQRGGVGTRPPPPPPPPPLNPPMTMGPDSDLGSYCLQYRPPKYISKRERGKIYWIWVERPN